MQFEHSVRLVMPTEDEARGSLRNRCIVLTAEVRPGPAIWFSVEDVSGEAGSAVLHRHLIFSQPPGMDPIGRHYGDAEEMRRACQLICCSPQEASAVAHSVLWKCIIGPSMRDTNPIGQVVPMLLPRTYQHWRHTKNTVNLQIAKDVMLT